MTALRLVLVITVIGMGVAESSVAQTADQLRTEIKKAEDFLKRIDEGANACFTPACQTEKAQILDRIFGLTETIPGSGQETLKSAMSALDTAQFMVDHPFLPPSNYFPEDLSEWLYWWNKRYSQEQTYRNQWFAFVGEAFALWEGLEVSILRSRADLDSQEMIQEAWDRGSPEIARLYHEQSWLADRAGVLKALGQAEESNRFMQQAQRVVEERSRLENEFFGGRFRQVMEELYPGLEFRKICAVQARLQFFMKVARAKKLFDPQVLKELSYWRSRLKSLNNSIKKYSDLEYGIVGLKNFDSLTNQAQAVEYEIVIQEFLDKVDFSGRAMTSIGASYLMSFMLSGTAYSNLIFFSSSMGLNYASARYEFDFTEFLWEPSYRSDQLESLLPILKEDMERRLSDLMRARGALAERIQLMKSQLIEIEKGDHS